MVKDRQRAERSLMVVDICPHCGATFTERESFAEHYAAEHPDEPFIYLNDTPDEDEGGRSWGGIEPTDADRPLNIFEETMEETPEDTTEDLERAEDEAAQEARRNEAA